MCTELSTSCSFELFLLAISVADILCSSSSNFSLLTDTGSDVISIPLFKPGSLPIFDNGSSFNDLLDSSLLLVSSPSYFRFSSVGVVLFLVSVPPCIPSSLLLLWLEGIASLLFDFVLGVDILLSSS